MVVRVTMVTTRGITDTMIVKHFSKRSRMLLLAVCDAIACLVASFVALWVRFDFTISNIPDKYGLNALQYAPIYIVGVLIVFNIFHLYSYMWSKASIRELLMIVASCFVATLLQIAGMIILEWHQPRSYYILCFIVFTILVGLSRYSWRLRKSYIKSGVKDIRSLPGTYQLMNSKNVTLAALNKVSIDDLLGREAIEVDNTEVFNNLKGKTILVTGVGGSIGSELVRRIMTHSPRKLIVFDIYENNVYDLQQELRQKGITENIEFLIGSVRNTHRMENIFEDYKPDIVFHAAAHKHVPLMEDSPNEAIKNNVFGTLKTARAAEKYGCEKFVLISTDKAVNPTNIMGASKRICEMIIQAKASRQKDISEGKMDPTEKNLGKTQFVAVRFGVGEIIGQTALRPQKYRISSDWCTPFVLFKNYFYSNSIEEKHGLSIPCINPIISKIILVSTKMLLKYLRFARALGNLIQLKFRGLSVLIGASKYSPYFDDGLLPTLI